MREIGVQALPHIERWQTSGGSLTINRGKGTVSIVKDRVHSDIGARKPLQHWATINWGKVKKRVRNLRQRIYRATQNGQWNRVRSLMKLMLRSYSNLLLSVRRVTQENQGRKTAGLDGQTALTAEQRVQLVNRLQDHSLWQVHPTKRVYIGGFCTTPRKGIVHFETFKTHSLLCRSLRAQSTVDTWWSCKR